MLGQEVTVAFEKEQTLGDAICGLALNDKDAN